MRMIKHRDDTISIRMTRSELADIGFSTNLGVNRWREIVKDGGSDGRKRSIDKRVCDDFEVLNDAIAAFAAELGVKY